MTRIVDLVAVTVTPKPFDDSYQIPVPAGMSIAQIVETAGLPVREHEHVVVCLNNTKVERRFWHLVYPKARPDLVVQVSVEPKGDGAFSAAATALSLTSAFVGFINPFAGVALSLIGSAVLNAFRPKPKTPGGPEPRAGNDVTGVAGTSLNVLPLNEQIPAVAGKIRAPLALLAPSYVEISNNDKIANVLVGMQGRTMIEDIEINDTPIANFGGDATVEILEGKPSDPAPTLFTRIVLQENLNEPLGEWEVKTSDYVTLVNDDNPSTSRPSYHFARSRNAPDEFWFHFVLPRGMPQPPGRTSSSTALTIEARLEGTDVWRKLPYIAIAFDDQQSSHQFAVKLIFSGDPTIVAFTDEPWDLVAAVATLAPATLGDDLGNFEWNGDLYFGTSVSVTADHTALFQDRIEFYLDPDDATNPWPKGEYEFRIQKGYTHSNKLTANRASHHNLSRLPTVAQVGGNAAYNFTVGNMVLESITNVWNEAPVTAPDMARVAIRARNIQISKITALMTGYSEVWNGSDWNAVADSGNPATWYRRAMTDKYLARPLPASLVDDAELATWFADNAAKGYRFNAVLQGGTTVEDVLQRTATAGHAKVFRGSLWSVWRDHDRTADLPTQILTPMNSRGLEVGFQFEDTPDALRIKFLNQDDNYREKELLIDRNGNEVSEGTIIEATDGEALGKTSIDEIKTWGRYLLQQRILRANAYSITVGLRSLHTKRGDLIGVTHDLLSTKFGFARATEIIAQGGTVTGMRLNNELRFVGAATNDIFAISHIYAPAHIFAVNSRFGVVIELSDGSTITKEINEFTHTDLVTFKTPFAALPGLVDGVMVGSGILDTETRRFLVGDVQPASDKTARLTLVDEASSIH